MIEKLQAIVGVTHVKIDADSLAIWACDATRHYASAATAIVFPASTEEVQAIVRLANLEKNSLVPSGGRTGLSAGAVAAHAEVVVSFDRMNKVLEFLPKLALSSPRSSCATQVRNDLVAMPRLLPASAIVKPCSVTSLIASRLNSSVKIRRGMRFMDSPDKLVN